MHFIRILIVLFCLTSVAFAQKRNQANWQQRVNYDINVTLKPQSLLLDGNITITYFNQSPNTLTEIYLHMWPNAYSYDQTAFAKQQIENGKTDFHFAEQTKRGYINGTNFKINNKAVEVKYTKDTDVIILLLNEPLLPNTNLKIETPFKVKLPDVFSRLGYEKGIYCITQWYPKPAVYDVNGWNPMPYLDQGEFYSEFGKFDVSITVPNSMVVAATGNIQNESEKMWWLNKMLNPQAPHPGGEGSKTLRFIQDSVHDFAWFASEAFTISKGHVDLPSGKRVDTWLFNIGNKDTFESRAGVNYINNGIRHYSALLGEYPYDQATVVITPLKAGGGMEYPTITNCRSVDETTIVHEVGHNWFYGILATNEREHPWMDESFNTYYENRNTHRANEIPQHNRFLKYLRKNGRNSLERFFNTFEQVELEYLLVARNNSDQPGHIASQQYTDANYGMIVYRKNPKLIYYLQSYLGDSLFDNMMRAYYEKWKFKHPLPDDFRQHAEQYSGKNLSWFFDELLGSNAKQDIKIKRVEKNNNSLTVNVQNNTSAPFSISGYIKDSLVYTSEFYTTNTVVIPNPGLTKIRIDAYEQTMDVNRKNNSMRVNGSLQKFQSIAFVPILDVESPYESRICYTPIIGANLYNKTMLGMALYNTPIPRKNWQYIVAPMYAFGTKDVTGYAELEKTFSPTTRFQHIQVGINSSRFAANNFAIDFRNPLSVYERVKPYVIFTLKPHDSRSLWTRKLYFDYILLHEQKHTRSLYSNFGNHIGFLNVAYRASEKHALSPKGYTVHSQFGNTATPFVKLNVEGTFFIPYAKPKKGLSVRGFAGIFLRKPDINTMGGEYYRVGDQTGKFDYTFDHAQFGRSELFFSNSIFTQQLMPGDAQFHVVGFSTSTDSWLTGVNLSTTLPGILPIRLYADVAMINSRTVTFTSGTGAGTNMSIGYSPELFYTGGIMLNLIPDIFQIHVPFFASSQITNYWETQSVKFQQRINFTLRLNALNPYASIKNFKL